MEKPETCHIIIPGDVRHQLDWLRDSPEGQAILQSLHPRQKQKRLRCACQEPPQQQAQMVIRHRDSSYHIARMPDTGHHHVRGQCDFYSERASSDRNGGGEYVKAIIHHDDVTDIKINFPLRKATPPDQDRVKTTSSSGKGRTQRDSLGLGGLLSHLWNEAAINTWNGGQGRRWEQLLRDLKTVAAGTTLGQRKLLDHLYLQPAASEAWLPPAPADVAQSRDMVLLLFKVSASHTTQYGSVYLKTSKGGSLFVKKPVMDALMRSYPQVRAEFALRAAREHAPLDRGPQVICLALAQWASIGKTATLVIQQAALMLASWRYIPVESSHELRIADLLVQQRRTFTKPMRYDADADVVFPDFILSDTGGDGTPMEVYGVNGSPVYEARKQEKRQHYLQCGAAFWEWTPASQAEPPPFPASQR